MMDLVSERFPALDRKVLISKLNQKCRDKGRSSQLRRNIQPIIDGQHINKTIYIYPASIIVSLQCKIRILIQ